MSTNYQRTIQEDFDDDGADAMEYEPSEKSLDQKSLLDDIPEPYQLENTNETLDPTHETLPQTWYFGGSQLKASSAPYYSNNENSQNISSSFLNLSDSVSQKENTYRAAQEKSIENAANAEGHQKQGHDASQELKQQIVELKRTLSLKDQDLMYTKKRNEKLANELNALKASMGPHDKPNPHFEQIMQENQFLKEKAEEFENELATMKEYYEEVYKDTDQAQLIELLRQEKEANEGLLMEREKLNDEKNQLLDYVDESLKEQEKVGKHIEFLEKENAQLKEGMKDLRISRNSSKADYDRQNFDTFGGDTDEGVFKLQLIKADETIQKLEEQLNKLTEERNIEKKSRETDLTNFKQKLEISERTLDDKDKCIKEMEEHYSNEIKRLKKTIDGYKTELVDLKGSDEDYQNHLNALKEEKLEFENRYKKMKDNYNALETTLSETQNELDEMKEKYEKASKNTQLKSEIHELKLRVSQYEKENENLCSLNKQQSDTIQNKTNKIASLTSEMQDLNSRQRELENEFDKINRENATLSRQIEASKNMSQNEEYLALDQECRELKQELNKKDELYNEMKFDFNKKLNEFQQLSQDYNQWKHAYQDLEYSFKTLEAQKKEKDKSLKQLIEQNDELTDKVQALGEENSRKKLKEIEEIKRREQEIDELKGKYETYLQTCKHKANEWARLVDEFNDNFFSWLNYSTQNAKNDSSGIDKEQVFDKKIISKNFRDFMILTDKIKPAKDYYEVQDVLEKIEEWILHSAEEFEVQLKNAANFKRKYLKETEKVDSLEEFHAAANNEEKMRQIREEDLKREINTLRSKLEHIESEKSCSYKREDKIARQVSAFKQELKAYTKENNRLVAQIKSLQQEKSTLESTVKITQKDTSTISKQTKDLEARIYHLLYEKDVLLDSLSILEKAIPSPELQSLFTSYISFQKSLFSLEDQKASLESSLLAKEKSLRATAKAEQLSQNVLIIRREVDRMRSELVKVEEEIENIRGKMNGVKDELHWVEIHERRRNEVVMQTERSLLEVKEENEVLRREFWYLEQAKNDLERAHRAQIEEKKMLERQLMTQGAYEMGYKTMGENILDYRQNMTSTMNPGDYLKHRIFPSQEQSNTISNSFHQKFDKQ
jgi:chromosome segregation ATPase